MQICSVDISDLGAQEPDSRPNILFIYADDQSYKTISCYGNSPDWVRTPNIDALAKQGLRFHRAYLGAWCMPSRASILTGRLQHAIPTMRMEGTYPGSAYDPEQCRFIPSEFRKQGYHTAQIGKWHTGIDTGYGRDWDYQIVWNRPGHPDNAGNYYVDQILTVNGKEQPVNKGYSTDNYTEWAVDYIRGANRTKDKPWYLWLCYGAIHGPTTPAERHQGSFAGKESEAPADILGPWPSKPEYLDDVRAWVKGPDGKPAMRRRNAVSSNFDTNESGKAYEAWIQQVNECNRAVDEGVGRLVAALQETGQLENTLIVYTADQGYALGEHGLNQKVAPYDASLASALILSCPGKVPMGAFCPHAVNSTDLSGYLCQQAGVKIPWKTHSRDIRPLIEQPERLDWNQPMLMTHTGRYYGEFTTSIPAKDDPALTETAGVPWYAMLREGNWKYVRNLVEGEMEELYDLQADPEELTNLALDPMHNQLLKRLRSVTVEELRQTDAPFVDHLPLPSTF
ncbi:MAG: sulfatase-like hydrolase/transferase [Planctomycetales bacterium]|nr:sulfatase-like hydrolase/transferase [Planctomycetales bacterium]